MALDITTLLHPGTPHFDEDRVMKSIGAKDTSTLGTCGKIAFALGKLFGTSSEYRTHNKTYVVEHIAIRKWFKNELGVEFIKDDAASLKGVIKELSSDFIALAVAKAKSKKEKGKALTSEKIRQLQLRNIKDVEQDKIKPLQAVLKSIEGSLQKTKMPY